MKIRRGYRPHKILKTLALTAGVLFISTISPVGGASVIKDLTKQYLRKKSFQRYKFLNDLKNLQNRKLINYQETAGGRVKITLTKNGREKLLVYKLDEMKLSKPAKWDKKWRLIMFDIPHSYKKARDAFRQKLRGLEFYPIQKSVFITPYPCEDEIDFIASLFNIRRYVLVMHVGDFEGEEKLKYHFGIR
jgi:DNA-binding transcriptional regulator PaaX